MLYTQEIQFSQLAVHKVGNKQQNEVLKLSNEEILIDEEIKELLQHYFLKPFKAEEYFHFVHPTSIEYNEVFSYVSAVFEQPVQLHAQSVELAKHLYEQSNHPNIKGGEFYVVYFKDCILDGETIDAVGLFKSENKDTFLKVKATNNNFAINSEQGININKLDKGCLIFNTEKDNGYVVAVVDNTNRQMEAQYWIDDFLQIEQREDNYFNTESTLSMYKQFVTEQLPEEYELNRADQAELLNRTMHYFKDREEFALQDFQNEVLQQDDVINSFNSYKRNYETERHMQLADEFPISASAVKRQNRNYKSVIKLDKNFHIYVHGDRSKIEQGEDQRGKFYKVYFEEER